MKSVVLFVSHKGNTREIAEAIAGPLGKRGTVQLLPINDANGLIPPETDLLIVGGPTEGHGMTDEVDGFFDQLSDGALNGIVAAAFDTRLHWPRWLSGSAASRIEDRLRQAGAHVIAPAESFIVTMEPDLEPAEVERAAIWASSLLDDLERRSVA